MGKNLGAVYGRMDDEQRKEFEGKPEGANEDSLEELDIEGDPRNPDKMGAHPQPLSDELKEQQETELLESGPPANSGEHSVRATPASSRTA